MPTVVDYYSEVNKDTQGNIKRVHPTADADPSALGETFTGDGQKLYSYKFFLKRTNNAPGNLIGRLYEHTGTWGVDGLPTGSPLDSSDILAASTISKAVFGLIEFTGFSGYILDNGVHWCMCIEAYDGLWSASRYVQMGRDDSSPTHPGNRFAWVSGAWGLATNAKAHCFYVYGVPVAAYYHGLKVQGVGELALCDVGNHPLRIRKGGTTYGVELVATGDSNASRIRIKTGAGIKAIRKYT